MSSHPQAHPAFSLGLRLLGSLVVAIGLVSMAGGTGLLRLGGSPYYLIPGAGLVLAGSLLFLGATAALWTYAVVLSNLLWAGAAGQLCRNEPSDTAIACGRC